MLHPAMAGSWVAAVSDSWRVSSCRVVGRQGLYLLTHKILLAAHSHFLKTLLAEAALNDDVTIIMPDWDIDDIRELVDWVTVGSRAKESNFEIAKVLQISKTKDIFDTDQGIGNKDTLLVKNESKNTNHDDEKTSFDFEIIDHTEEKDNGEAADDDSSISSVTFDNESLDLDQEVFEEETPDQRLKSEEESFVAWKMAIDQMEKDDRDRMKGIKKAQLVKKLQ